MIRSIENPLKLVSPTNSDFGFIIPVILSVQYVIVFWSGISNDAQHRHKPPAYSVYHSYVSRCHCFQFLFKFNVIVSTTKYAIAIGAVASASQAPAYTPLSDWE